MHGKITLEELEGIYENHKESLEKNGKGGKNAK